MLRLLALTALLLEVSHSQIRSCGNKRAGFGEDTKLECVLDNVKGVEQVMWQLILPDQTEHNVASYSEQYGKEVNGPYREKVFFTEASLSSPSITVKNLTWSDESCYVCWFNIFPDGSLKGQSCLSVEGISDVVTGAHVTYGAKGLSVVFSCSATGKPTPVIHWEVSTNMDPAEDSQNQTLINADHTWTSSSNITLEVPNTWTGHVDCVVNRGMKGEQRKRIPLALPETHREQNDSKEDEVVLLKRPVGIILSVAVVSVLVLVAVVTIIWKIYTQPRNRRDMNV